MHDEIILRGAVGHQLGQLAGMGRKAAEAGRFFEDEDCKKQDSWVVVGRMTLRHL